MKVLAGLIIIVFVGGTMWGCPSRKIIPNPEPPAPIVIDSNVTK